MSATGTAGGAHGRSAPHRQRAGPADEGDQALLWLGRELLARGYRFVTTTPATHRRVNGNPGNAIGNSLEAIFGWSRPFQRSSLPAAFVYLLQEAGALETRGELLLSKVRFSSLGN